MSAPSTGAAVVSFPYETFRNISTQQDEANGRKILTGKAHYTSFLDLETDENVRDYLVEAPGKKRRQSTAVHRAMRDTLINNPENFSIQNGGVVIVARGFEVDEKKRVLKLKKPSIINGSQTQGVLRDFHDGLSSGERVEVYLSFEVLITDDEDLIANTSIARNFQNDVMTISIIGRKGMLKDLERVLKEHLPDASLRTSETMYARQLDSEEEDYILTEKLIQVCTALIPDELWPKPGEPGAANKVYTYSAKEKCLKEFETMWRKANDPGDSEHEKYAQLYRFFLDIASQALELYEHWRQHQGFIGTYIRSVKREGGKTKEVPDGIIFPILAAMSVFARQTPVGWRIATPPKFQEEELIRAAKTAYMDTATSNPSTMGKSKACYSQLHQITSIYKRLLVEDEVPVPAGS